MVLWCVSMLDAVRNDESFGMCVHVSWERKEIRFVALRFMITIILHMSDLDFPKTQLKELWRSRKMEEIFSFIERHLFVIIKSPLPTVSVFSCSYSPTSHFILSILVASSANPEVKTQTFDSIHSFISSCLYISCNPLTSISLEKLLSNIIKLC